MGVVEDFKGASILCKVAFVLLLIASVFTFIGYTTTSWVYDSIENGGSNYFGLWRVCDNGEVPTGCTQIDGWANDWFGVVQAFVTFGFFGILISFFLVILFMFVGKCQKNKEVAIAVAIICIATGIFYLIGCILFASKSGDTSKWPEGPNVNYKLGFSFALSIVALALEIIAGIIMIFEGMGSGGGSTKPSA